MTVSPRLPRKVSAALAIVAVAAGVAVGSTVLGGSGAASLCGATLAGGQFWSAQAIPSYSCFGHVEYARSNPANAGPPDYAPRLSNAAGAITETAWNSDYLSNPDNGHNPAVSVNSPGLFGTSTHPDAYISFRITVPVGYPTIDRAAHNWNLFFETYGTPYAGSPPVGLDISAANASSPDRYILTNHVGAIQWSGPITFGVGDWIVVREHFATDNTGLVQIYENGVLGVTVNEPTLLTGVNWNGGLNTANFSNYRARDLTAQDPVSLTFSCMTASTSMPLSACGSGGGPTGPTGATGTTSTTTTASSTTPSTTTTASTTTSTPATTTTSSSTTTTTTNPPHRRRHRQPCTAWPWPCKP